MELFDDFKPAPGSPLDFHINGKISVREESGSVEVKYGFLPLAKFTRSDWAEVYQAAITLATITRFLMSSLLRFAIWTATPLAN
jgi:hypothetical protein